MNNFSDIFKKTFLDGYSSELGVDDMLISIAATCGIALYIFFVYRIVTRKTFYSKTMNISLAALSIITASVILAVQSSIVISLGMVGALSIVRFRTAIKDPMDLVFLFWSISVGIICGAGLVGIAAITSLVLTAAIFILDRIPISKSPLMLVVNCSDIDAEQKIIEVVAKHAKYYKVKSRNFTKGSLDMVIELRLRDEASCIKEVLKLPFIESASLLAHDGEVTF